MNIDIADHLLYYFYLPKFRRLVEFGFYGNADKKFKIYWFLVCQGLRINIATTRMYVKESIEFPNTKHFHLMQGSIRLSYILFFKVCSLNKYVKWKLFAFCLLTWICIKFSNRRKVFFNLRLSILLVPLVGFIID